MSNTISPGCGVLVSLMLFFSFHVTKAEEEFDELCFEFGLELDEVVCDMSLIPSLFT